jgi:hypothetical protein
MLGYGERRIDRILSLGVTFWDATICQRFQKDAFLLLDPEDGGTTIPRNIRKYSPMVTEAHHNRTSDVTGRLPVKPRRHNTEVVGSTFMSR